MTCLTVVRLGQILNKSRPQNELTMALKGRIAYLPLDVKANAKFIQVQQPVCFRCWTTNKGSESLDIDG